MSHFFVQQAYDSFPPLFTFLTIIKRTNQAPPVTSPSRRTSTPGRRTEKELSTILLELYFVN